MRTLKFYFLRFSSSLIVLPTYTNPIELVLLRLHFKWNTIVFKYVSYLKRFISNVVEIEWEKLLKNSSLPNVWGPMHWLCTGVQIKNSSCWGNRVKDIIVLQIEQDVLPQFTENTNARYFAWIFYILKHNGFNFSINMFIRKLYIFALQLVDVNIHSKKSNETANKTCCRNNF